MISHILVPMDDSEMAAQALRYALKAHPDAEITVLHVVGEPSPMWGKASGLAFADNLEEAAQEQAQDVFQHAHEIATEYDAEIDTEVQLGHPVRAILRRADDYETVVIGSHGGTVSDRLFIGNVAQKIVRRSPVPVTVVR